MSTHQQQFGASRSHRWARSRKHPHVSPLTAAVVAAAVGAGGAAHAAQSTATWTGGSANLNWQDNANWSGSAFPANSGTTATFIAKFTSAGLAAGNVIDLAGNLTIDQLQVGDTVGVNATPAFTVTNSASGARLTITGGTAFTAIQTGTQQTQTASVAANLLLAPNSTNTALLKFNPQGGALVITGTIADNSAVTGVAVGIDKNTGGSALTLAGVNTYSGQTLVQQNNVIVATNALSGVVGALGNATTAVSLGGPSTTGTKNVGLLTNGPWSVGRDVFVYNSASAGVPSLGGNQTGGSLYTGAVTINRDLQLTSASTGTNAVEFRGPLAAGTVGAAVGIIKTGAGSVLISNVANTYAGDTTVRNGALWVSRDVIGGGAAGTLGTSADAITVGDAGTTGTQSVALLTSGNVTVARDVVVSAANTATGSVTLGGRTNQSVGSTFAGAILLNRTAASAAFQSYATGTNAVTFAGAIGGPGGLQTVGSGAVAFNADDAYLGTTTVGPDGKGGTLLVNGHLTGGGGFEVATGATLGGTGSIATGTGRNGVHVAVGGTLAPGLTSSVASFLALPSGTGSPKASFAITGDVDLAGTLSVVLGAGGSVGSFADTGALTVEPAATLKLNDASAGLTAGAYVLASYSTLSGAFDPANVTGLPAGYALDYAYDGNSIALVSTATPEPASIGLVALAGAGLLRRRRR